MTNNVITEIPPSLLGRHCRIIGALPNAQLVLIVADSGHDYVQGEIKVKGRPWMLNLLRSELEVIL